MKNIVPGPHARIDDCRTVVIFSDVCREVVDAMPVSLHEEDPLVFPEPGFSCMAQLGNGEVVGILYGTATRRLAFFPGFEIPTGNSSTVDAIIRESRLPEENVSYRWDHDLGAEEG
ncbi:hypothetical protein [Luteolibacter soli]|uniref:Uncharacterized protein n=1 Tax=Luteolibacter soli TaxID=3135280 RepID=A0ABU9B0M5_9BACT